ncbi:MAG: homoserine kinase [Rhodospirillales bacterium]|mgnify:CR=1 FL=1|jgi:homoserine kinase type II|nr:homoserine kinase [Rhodospirillales bacterium]MBT4006660.1 homoserine kinase [Rhodospirillales bacterium]MBT5076378.1 homoserine kinase [Rhodospirillales bacterium]MBT5113938.1 homoserine kinase [Rhodospirillales bacterium]MBT5672466.1 homoserine kinase [Rhodospirillales bacterium]
MAVYTEVNDDELSAFLTQYDLGQLLSYKGIAEGVENSNFLLQTDQGNFILTLYEKRTKKEDLPFFLDLMDHLAASDFACPTPVHGRDGKALKTLAGRPAAIVSFLNGVWPRRIQPYHTAALGKAMAQMHLASEAFTQTRSNDLGLAQWRPLFNQISANVDDISKGLGDEIMTELDALEANWPEGLPHGIIHADLFPDNVFFLGKDFSGFIDFYFSCTDSYAYDLAICLNAWCFEKDNSFNITKARHMFQGYQKLRPLVASELAALTWLARGAAMRFLLTRLYDWINHPEGAMVTAKDPKEYLSKLRFHQRLSGPGAYGLDG